MPDSDRIFTCTYTDHKASYVKRFKFGGTILNKTYACIPGKALGCSVDVGELSFAEKGL